jgi:general stress protein YciG
MSDSNPIFAGSASIPEPTPKSTTKRRGFAAMDRELVRELARRGGAAAHRAGTAHEFSSDEARAAGRKGGLAAHAQDKQPPVAPPLPAE